MRAAQPATHSRPSWARPCGTRPCPTMGTTFSWSTWIWRSSCRRTVSLPTQPRATRLNRQHSRHRPLSNRLRRPPHPHPPWWTSAAALPPQFTQAWRLRPASTAPAQQVRKHMHMQQSLMCTWNHTCTWGGGGGAGGGHVGSHTCSRLLCAAGGCLLTCCSHTHAHTHTNTNVPPTHQCKCQPWDAVRKQKPCGLSPWRHQHVFQSSFSFSSCCWLEHLAKG